MAFAKAIKEEVRKRADFRCCACSVRSMGLEVHHIVPQKEGGDDFIENAAPLCPSCHRDYGGNPDLRSRIREMRDALYERCKERSNHEKGIGEVRKRDENKPGTPTGGVAVHTPGYRTGAVQAVDGLTSTRFSFGNDEYVHPLILQELLGWISDSGETIVGVDLDEANESNRFHGDFTTEERPAGRWVIWKKEKEWFGYRHVGTTASGILITLESKPHLV